MVGLRVGGSPCDNQRVCYHGGRHCHRRVIACVLLDVFVCSLSENGSERESWVVRTSVAVSGDDEAAVCGCVRKEESAFAVV